MNESPTIIPPPRKSRAIPRGLAIAVIILALFEWAAEQDHVTGLSQLGIRNVSSTSKEGYDAARAMGSDILSVRQVRKRRKVVHE